MATKPKRYTVRYEREHDVWVATSERPGAQSRSRSLKQVQARIRKALAMRANVKPEQLELEHEVWLPSAARSILNAAQKANLRADAEARRAQEATRTAAFKLVKSGMTLGDVATLLGLPLQHVRQILAGGNPV